MDENLNSGEVLTNERDREATKQTSELTWYGPPQLKVRYSAEQLRQSNLLSTWPRKQTITHITASQTQPTDNSDVVAPDFLQAGVVDSTDLELTVDRVYWPEELELISKLVPNLAR